MKSTSNEDHISDLTHVMDHWSVQWTVIPLGVRDSSWLRSARLSLSTVKPSAISNVAEVYTLRKWWCYTHSGNHWYSIVQPDERYVSKNWTWTWNLRQMSWEVWNERSRSLSSKPHVACCRNYTFKCPLFDPLLLFTGTLLCEKELSAVSRYAR
jgi:hypothetical protein